MVVSVKLSQGLITLFHDVIKVELTPEITETVVKYLVTNLSVFIASHRNKCKAYKYSDLFLVCRGFA